MQIEIYNMTVLNDKLNISLEAVCDSFSSLCGILSITSAVSLRCILLHLPEILRFFRQGESWDVMTTRNISD